MDHTHHDNWCKQNRTCFLCDGFYVMDRKRPNLTRCLKLAQPFDLWFIRNHYDIYTSARNYSFFDETSPVLSYLEVTLFWNDYNKINYLAKKDGMPNWVHEHPVDHIQSSAKGLWQENRCHEHPLDRIGKPWDFLNATTYGLCWTSTNIYYIHDCRIAVIGTVWPTIWKNWNHTGESERYRCCIKILLKQKLTLGLQSTTSIDHDNK